MKILSKFHDYYDSAAAYGVSDVYWTRQPEVAYREDETLEDIFRNAECWGGTPTIVMFCGKAYGGILMQKGYSDPEVFLVTRPEDFDTYREIYEKSLQDWTPTSLNWPRLDPLANRFRRSESYATRGFSAFLEDVARLDCEPYHREYNSAILQISHVGQYEDTYYRDRRGMSRKRVTIKSDSSLKRIGFQKVKDAFSAYQEIDSYLSGVLGVSVNPTVEISDVHRLEGHGFDKRTSFRNMKR